MADGLRSNKHENQAEKDKTFEMQTRWNEKVFQFLTEKTTFLILKKYYDI